MNRSATLICFRAKRAFLVSMLIAIIFCAPASANSSDWVEDDELDDFYAHELKYGVKQSPSPDADSLTPPMMEQSSGPFQYHNQGYGEDFQSDARSRDIGTDNENMSFTAPDFLANPGYSPKSPNNAQQDKKSGSWLGRLGRSIISFPKDLIDGTGDFMDAPEFWRDAGAVAGMGANAYMWNRNLNNNLRRYPGMGLSPGWNSGWNPGWNPRFNPGWNSGWNPGWNSGWNPGWNSGWNPYSPSLMPNVTPLPQFNPLTQYNRWNRMNSPFSPSPFPQTNDISNWGNSFNRPYRPFSTGTFGRPGGSLFMQP